MVTIVTNRRKTMTNETAITSDYSICLFTANGTRFNPCDIEELTVSEVISMLRISTQLDLRETGELVLYGTEYDPVAVFKDPGINKTVGDLLISKPVYDGLVGMLKRHLA